MTVPSADETLRLADRRLLAWAEWGDPRGNPVIFLHPWPGSRLLCPDPAATTAAGLRLITVDRPGYGRSDPVPDPTLTSFAADLERLADHLWLGQFPVVGWSTGGQYAAAAAAVLGARVTVLVMIAAPAPDEAAGWLAAPARELTGLAGLAALARADPARALAAAAGAGVALTAAPDQAGLARSSSPGPAVASRPAAAQALAIMCREAFRAGPAGWAGDLVASARPWGFDPARVTAPATLIYGQDDPRAGPAHGRWWARALPAARLVTRPASGHLVLEAWPGILAAARSRP